ncbi:MAG TPA: rod shape-determining protein [Vicinamibacterales bacterium]|nr:rod shape-determining protein [Vicinamibacterales bacterium]
MLLNIMPFGARDLAIDLGTANTIVFAAGRGIVVDEPSIVAINTASEKTEAVGHDAHAMLGRTPASIRTIRPMRDGVIADFEAAERMLTSFIRKAQGPYSFRRTRVVIGIPSGITQVERRAVIDSAYRAKASQVHLVEEGMAAALGAGLPVSEPRGSMIVDIGGGTTDIAVVALGGMVYDCSVRVAGNTMDDAIIQYMRRRHGLLIGERTAEQVKIEIGSACNAVESLNMEVRGRCMREGRPRVVKVSDTEIREALGEPLKVIIAAVKEALDSVPPEIAADISDNGIVVTGGGAMLRGLDERLRRETGVPVSIADEPLTSVVRGVGLMLDDLALLKRVTSPAA